MKARSAIVRTLGAAAAAGALAWIAVTGGATGTPTAQDSAALAAVAGENPGYAVEDYNYPQADRILAEKNIVLKRGDGHITLVDCASGTGFLEVWARSKDKICFQVSGNSGWLTMEIPSVYGVKGNDYATQVDMTVGTEEKSFDIAKNAWTAVGESADEQGREHMLVEIRSSK
ncbi:hypothetical protein I2W78_08300 [Streptomyces spinoverrucosus]|uniref:hypothetical protein n=1 Tax=Streptomyces spinoverrucosus TaxID=284043 RepID=UPI0018C3E507|nr:hypothetical protein [Streptomyces spinoverrucosus]MBG0851845.1 hypothetical protein [Streptomyces spinoverrucosus]